MTDQTKQTDSLSTSLLQLSTLPINTKSHRILQALTLLSMPILLMTAEWSRPVGAWIEAADLSLEPYGDFKPNMPYSGYWGVQTVLYISTSLMTLAILKRHLNIGTINLRLVSLLVSAANTWDLCILLRTLIAGMPSSHQARNIEMACIAIFALLKGCRHAVLPDPELTPTFHYCQHHFFTNTEPSKQETQLSNTNSSSITSLRRIDMLKTQLQNNDRVRQLAKRFRPRARWTKVRSLVRKETNQNIFWQTLRDFSKLMQRKATNIIFEAIDRAGEMAFFINIIGKEEPSLRQQPSIELSVLALTFAATICIETMAQYGKNRIEKIGIQLVDTLRYLGASIYKMVVLIDLYFLFTAFMQGRDINPNDGESVNTPTATIAIGVLLGAISNHWEFRLLKSLQKRPYKVTPEPVTQNTGTPASSADTMMLEDADSMETDISPTSSYRHLPTPSLA